jgi:hypothetical protein
MQGSDTQTTPTSRNPSSKTTPRPVPPSVEVKGGPLRLARMQTLTSLLLRINTVFLGSSHSLFRNSHARQKLLGAVACRLYVIPTRKLFLSGKFSTGIRFRAFNTPVSLSTIVNKISNLAIGIKPKMAPKDEVFVGSIDQGTTSSRFLIFDKAGEPVAVYQKEFKQIYPNPGYVPQNNIKGTILKTI